MECPHKDFEDTSNENFSEYDADCKNCRHYEECNEKNCVGDNHPVFSASTRNKLHNKFPEFDDKKRFEKGKILQEDIINFSFNLWANEPKEIWNELNKVQIRGDK